MKNAILGLAFCAAMPLFAQQKATVTVHPEQGKQIINKRNLWSVCRTPRYMYLWRSLGRRGFFHT